MVPRDEEDVPTERRILRDLGFFGHFMHVYLGGRSGKRHLLAHLHKSGGQLSQRELQEHAGISAAALSEVLAKLEAEELIVRRRSSEDRRQMDVTLTEEGRRRAVELMSSLEAFERASVDCFDERECEELLGLLDRMARHWRDMEKRGVCA